MFARRNPSLRLLQLPAAAGCDLGGAARSCAVGGRPSHGQRLAAEHEGKDRLAEVVLRGRVWGAHLRGMCVHEGMRVRCTFTHLPACLLTAPAHSGLAWYSPAVPFVMEQKQVTGEPSHAVGSPPGPPRMHAAAMQSAYRPQACSGKQVVLMAPRLEA